MLRSACMVSVALLLASQLVFSQSSQTQPRNRVESYGIRGKVIIPNQRGGEERIEVRLERSALQVIQTVYTDAAGGFDFRNLAPGTYYVSITVEGYEPVHQLVEIYNNFGNASVTIMLNKPAVEFRERLTGLDAADPTVVDVGQMRENFPRKAIQNYEKAIDEKGKGRLETAVKLLEEAIEIAPNFFHAHNNLGILYQSMKRFDDAEKEFKRSQQLNTKTERPLVNLGSLYIEQSILQKTDQKARGLLLDRALDALEDAIKLNSRSAVAYLLLGQANYRSDFLEEAEAAFKKAHELDAHLGTAQLMLANVYLRLEKWQEVLTVLDGYLKENPKAQDRASIEEMRARITQNLQTANERGTNTQ